MIIILAEHNVPINFADHFTKLASKYSSVFRETDVLHLPNQSMVAISVIKLWPWKLGQGHQNLISYWSCLIYIGLQIW